MNSVAYAKDSNSTNTMTATRVNTHFPTIVGHIVLEYALVPCAGRIFNLALQSNKFVLKPARSLYVENM